MKKITTIIAFVVYLFISVLSQHVTIGDSPIIETSYFSPDQFATVTFTSFPTNMRRDITITFDIHGAKYINALQVLQSCSPLSDGSQGPVSSSIEVLFFDKITLSTLDSKIFTSDCVHPIVTVILELRYVNLDAQSSQSIVLKNIKFKRDDNNIIHIPHNVPLSIYNNGVDNFTIDLINKDKYIVDYDHLLSLSLLSSSSSSSSSSSLMNTSNHNNNNNNILSTRYNHAWSSTLILTINNIQSKNCNTITLIHDNTTLALQNGISFQLRDKTTEPICIVLSLPGVKFIPLLDGNKITFEYRINDILHPFPTNTELVFQCFGHIQLISIYKEYPMIFELHTYDSSQPGTPELLGVNIITTGQILHWVWVLVWFIGITTFIIGAIILALIVSGVKQWNSPMPRPQRRYKPLNY